MIETFRKSEQIPMRLSHVGVGILYNDFSSTEAPTVLWVSKRDSLTQFVETERDGIIFLAKRLADKFNLCLRVTNEFSDYQFSVGHYDSYGLGFIEP